MKINLKFHHDAGHGWLKVEKDFFIKTELSKCDLLCSYQDKKFVYLEEDCDAPKFLAELVEKDIDYSLETIFDGDFSQIRNKERLINEKNKFKG